MGSIGLEIAIVLLLILFNGLLSMSELAVVSARKPRLQQMADKGNQGAATAIELASAPGQFLSTVQIGITMVGILSGAFGGATLARWLAGYLARVPVLGAYADTIAVGLVVLVITYLSLVIGEIVPKRLALRNPEGVAARVAKFLRGMARVTAPLVRVLNGSTNAILRLLGASKNAENAVTEDEVRLMLSQATQQGVFEPMEEEIVDQVFRLADRRVDALMTPRTEMVWININDSADLIREQIISSSLSRFPVADTQIDQILGVVIAKDILAQSLRQENFDLRAIVRPAVFVPESTPALTVVERFKQTQSKLAIVIDEYGGVAGLVTVDDILSAIVGDIPEHDEELLQGAVQRGDGSWLIDGLFPVEELQVLLNLRALPEIADGYYQTVGGLVMAGLGHVPEPGNRYEWQGLCFEVMDMDGRRVDKVLLTQDDRAASLDADANDAPN